MDRVFDCVTGAHDLRLVLLAACVCAFASFAAVNFISRMRSAGRWGRLGRLVAAAMVFGCGIWATHFIAMLAFQPGMPVGYDISLTVLSVLLAIFVSGIGIAVVSQGRPLFGGAILGIATAMMHYTGTSAIRAPADIHWSGAYVVASVFIGIFLGAAAMHVVARSHSFRPRLAAAGLLTGAICGLHFTAMSAMTIVYNPLKLTPALTTIPNWLALGVAIVSVIIVALALVGSALDARLADRSEEESKRLRLHVEELEQTKKKLEDTSAQLRLALNQAAAGNQAKSQFLAMMSHELRTPLNAIIGFSEVLMREFLGPVGNIRYREYAQDIHESGTHLLSLINDVLDLSMIDAGRLDLHEEEMQPSVIVEGCLRFIEPQAKSTQLRIHNEVGPNLPSLLADERRVRQVMLNVLSNAAKFTPPGGDIHITASSTSAGFFIHVRDTGIGMAAEDIPKVMERFVQIDSTLSRKSKGTGLGLPLSKELMAHHGGTITIESAVGQGTAVTLQFPPSRVIARSAVA